MSTPRPRYSSTQRFISWLGTLVGRSKRRRGARQRPMGEVCRRRRLGGCPGLLGPARARRGETSPAINRSPPAQLHHHRDRAISLPPTSVTPKTVTRGFGRRLCILIRPTRDAGSWPARRRAVDINCLRRSLGRSQRTDGQTSVVYYTQKIAISGSLRVDSRPVQDYRLAGPSTCMSACPVVYASQCRR